MKIHAGKFRNHTINRVKTDTTKETSSIVREAVFNMIGTLKGKALDLFAGSGSYGLTAFSLGCSFVVFTDNNYLAVKTIKENVNKLNISSETKVLKTDYQMFLNKNIDKFTYIFLDPPYSFKSYETLINNLGNHLTTDGLVILELDNKTNIKLEDVKMEAIKDKKYGIKRVIIFKNK